MIYLLLDNFFDFILQFLKNLVNDLLGCQRSLAMLNLYIELDRKYSRSEIHWEKAHILHLLKVL